MPEEYDAIIVGGGPVGSVLAARLTEDPQRSVLLLEAGPDYGPDPKRWPHELTDPVGTQHYSHTWGYFNAPDPAGRQMHLPRARVLGGCSTVNGCVWLRGSRRDYDHWVALGNPGWGFDDLLPYFRRAESDPGGNPRLHGRDGPVPVSRATDEEMTPLDWAFIDAAQTSGFDQFDDLNGAEAQLPGVGRTPKNIADGIRFSAPFSHLALARPRATFTLRADTLVDRIIVDGGRATGVVTADGRTIRGGEILLAGGAYNTPAILMRSGIGCTDHLGAMGIRPVVELPGVGAHVLDHPVIMRESRLTQYVLSPDCLPLRRVTGQTILKARSRQASEEIDLHVTPNVDYDDAQGAWILHFTISLQYARSMGEIRLASCDPEAPPAIDLNYFSEPADLEALCDGVELMRELAATAPLAAMIHRPRFPDEGTMSRGALRAAIRDRAQTTHHPSTSCRMGPASDPMAVVDGQGRVHGMEHLWIADPSIMPFCPRANIHCSAVTVAERVADLFRAAVF